MKLVRFGGPGIEKPGLLDPAGRIRDLSIHLSDFDDTIICPSGLAALRRLDWHSLPVIDSADRIGPILERTNRLITVDGNGCDAAATRPFNVGLKATRPTGPEDPIAVPRDCAGVRIRVALGVVIGARLRYASISDTKAGIAGYCLASDVIDTSKSAEDGMRALAGSSETFAPLGPCLATSDEVGAPEDLRWSLQHNGMHQSSGTFMHGGFGIPEIVSMLSHSITFWPCDVVLVAGTCDRRITTAAASLQPGDATMSEIPELGQQRHSLVMEGES
jgi:hypothetical protein